MLALNFYLCANVPIFWYCFVLFHRYVCHSDIFPHTLQMRINWLLEEKHRKTIYNTFLSIKWSLWHEIYQKIARFYKRKKFFVKICKTRNMRSLSDLMDRTSYVSSVVYEGKCICGKNCIDERGWKITISCNEHCERYKRGWKVTIRWNKH